MSLPFPNTRYKHFDIVTKFLLIEHHDGITDTKKEQGIYPNPSQSNPKMRPKAVSHERSRNLSRKTSTRSSQVSSSSFYQPAGCSQLLWGVVAEFARIRVSPHPEFWRIRLHHRIRRPQRIWLYPARCVKPSEFDYGHGYTIIDWCERDLGTKRRSLPHVTNCYKNSISRRLW